MYSDYNFRYYVEDPYLVEDLLMCHPKTTMGKTLAQDRERETTWPWLPSLVHSSENRTNPIVRVLCLTSVTMETKYQCPFWGEHFRKSKCMCHCSVITELMNAGIWIQASLHEIKSLDQTLSALDCGIRQTESLSSSLNKGSLLLHMGKKNH